MSTGNGSEHEGHRKLVKKKFLRDGLDGFAPHEALEMYLFYAIPRRDTNVLAHRMLNRYLTIAGVCDAPIDELMKEFGLSENTAILLKLLPEMSRRYEESKLCDDYIISLETIGDVIKTKFIGRVTEVVALVLGDAKGRMIFFDVIAKGSVNSTDFPIRRVVELAIRHNARTVFIAHNHPSGSAVPSEADVKTTVLLAQTLRNVGVRLIDHFIIADGDYVSLRESNLI